MIVSCLGPFRNALLFYFYFLKIPTFNSSFDHKTEEEMAFFFFFGMELEKAEETVINCHVYDCGESCAFLSGFANT